MPTPKPLLALVVLALPACDRQSTPSPPGAATPTGAPSVPVNSTTASASAAATTTGPPPERVAADQPMTLGHIRVSIKKVSVGKVPLKDVDGSITYAPDIRLMIALKIENVSDKRASKYDTWVPDLDAAKTVARLTDDRGTELKRVTLGFGNNVKDRTTQDTLTPGKVIGDLLVFEAPGMDVKHLDLDLPGANCGVKGTFKFRIDATMFGRGPAK